MRTSLAALAAGFLACAPARGPRPPEGDISLSVEGKVEDGPLYLTWAQAERLPRRSFRSREPISGREVRFDGISLAALLDDQARPEKRADIAILRTRRGVAVVVPLVRIRELRPVLADRADGKPMAEWAREANLPGETWVLAWPNLDQPGLDFDPRARWWWATGVSRVVLESWLATYGKALRVPDGAPDDARRGAEDLQLHCMPCHRVRGVGGERGPSLPEAVTERTPAAFADSVRPHAQVRGLPPGSEGDEALLRIASFLEAVRAGGTTGGADSPGEPEEPPEAPQRPAGAPGAPAPPKR